MKLSKILRDLAHSIYLDAVTHGLYLKYKGLSRLEKQRRMLIDIGNELE